MLVKLVVENLALIDHLDLDYRSGLVVLTGETGAGKSLVLDALSLILGYRASTDLIRIGADKAMVQAVFEGVQLPAEFASLVDDGQLIISREVMENGRSVSRVNGQLVTVGLLRQLGPALVDLHGQHEHQSLLVVERHRELLDKFAGAGAQSLLSELERLTAQYSANKRELTLLLGDDRERERRLDMLRFQQEEIAAARLQPGEEERLHAERKLLANYEKLFSASNHAYALLYQGGERQSSALEQLGDALVELQTAARFDDQLGTLAESLQSSLFVIEDVAHSLRDYLEQLAHDPARLEQIERRLDLLTKLKRKYGETVEQVIAYSEQVSAEIARIAGSEQRIAALNRELAKVQQTYSDVAAELSRLRRSAGKLLEGRVGEQLAALGLPDARFAVSLVAKPDQAPSRYGEDQVEFLFTANQGDVLRPLVKVISGGEMSRVMLALKSVLAADDAIDTLVFDEIDVGLGGRVALRVGEKLRQLARDHQVICISHLASIACMADQHLLISKHSVDGSTYTRVSTLDGEARVQEIARLLDGETSQIAYQHARELLQQASRV